MEVTPNPQPYMQDASMRDSLGRYLDGLSIGAQIHEQHEAGVIRLDSRQSAIDKVYALRRSRGQMPAEAPRIKQSINWKLLFAICLVFFVLKKFFNL